MLLRFQNIVPNWSGRFKPPVYLKIKPLGSTRIWGWTPIIFGLFLIQKMSALSDFWDSHAHDNCIVQCKYFDRDIWQPTATTLARPSQRWGGDTVTSNDYHYWSPSFQCYPLTSVADHWPELRLVLTINECKWRQWIILGITGPRKRVKTPIYTTDIRCTEKWLT